MTNIDKGKIIRIYGVTLASKSGRTRSYGHGRTKLEGEEAFVEYVNYFIDDLISLIKQEGLENQFIKKLQEKK